MVFIRPGDWDASAVFHVPTNFKERIAYDEFMKNLLSKKNDPDFQDISTYARGIDGDGTSTPEPFGPEDSWSILWYFASFSGLIVFFLVVSCSEWCCRKHIRRSNSSQQTSSTPPSPTGSNIPEAPPPAYDLFAPPSYESLTSTSNQRNKEKSEYDVYVVPVHAIGSVLGASASEVPEDAPPSYSAINMNFVPDQNSMEGLRIGGRSIGNFGVNQSMQGANLRHEISHQTRENSNQSVEGGNARNLISDPNMERRNINNFIPNQPIEERNTCNFLSNQPTEERNINNFMSNQPMEERNISNFISNQPMEDRNISNFMSNQPMEDRNISNCMSNQNMEERNISNFVPNQHMEERNRSNFISIQHTEERNIGDNLRNSVPAQNLDVVTIIPTIPDQSVREVRTGNVAT